MSHTDKIISTAEARRRRAELTEKGRTLVFTNGCFDLLHPGHLRYLAEAHELGDFLLVGLNSDRSVNSLKGPERPVCPQEVRAEMLAGLTMVDGVVIFEEKTPLRLIEALRPDVLVKGGDWTIENIVGSDLVAGYGGQVRSLKLAEGFSTTSLIAAIKAKCR